MFGFKKKEPEIEAQGIFDAIGMFDAETVAKIKAILASIDPEKIKLIMDNIKTEDGWVRVQIDLGIKRPNEDSPLPH
tara:strand:+ start:648 stop:878 length:231 start_codon:yes stop_codon:yes gene_type:complete